MEIVEVCVAIFWPDLGFKERTSDSLRLSAEVTLIPASRVPHSVSNGDKGEDHCLRAVPHKFLYSTYFVLFCPFFFFPPPPPPSLSVSGHHVPLLSEYSSVCSTLRATYVLAYIITWTCSVSPISVTSLFLCR